MQNVFQEFESLINHSTNIFNCLLWSFNQEYPLWRFFIGIFGDNKPMRSPIIMKCYSQCFAASKTISCALSHLTLTTALDDGYHFHFTEKENEPLTVTDYPKLHDFSQKIKINK